MQKTAAPAAAAAAPPAPAPTTQPATSPAAAWTATASALPKSPSATCATSRCAKTSPTAGPRAQPAWKGRRKAQGQVLISYFLSAKKLTPKQSHHNRSHQSLSTKQASSPGKPCASSYEKNSIDSLNQQLAVSYQFDASGNRVQISNAPAGGAAAEIGSYSYDASGRMLSGRDDKRKKARGQVLHSYFHHPFFTQPAGKFDS